MLQKGEIHNGRIICDERLYTDCRLDLNGKVLAIGTTHLPFQPRFRTTPGKLAMAKSLLSRRSALPDSYILAGDLNATPGTRVTRELMHGMRNGGPAAPTKTWTTKPFAIGPWSYHGLQWRLDYIFYRGNLRKQNASVAQTSLSDHLPLLTTFELTG